MQSARLIASLTFILLAFPAFAIPIGDGNTSYSLQFEHFNRNQIFDEDGNALNASSSYSHQMTIFDWVHGFGDQFQSDLSFRFKSYDGETLAESVAGNLTYYFALHPKNIFDFGISVGGRQFFQEHGGDQNEVHFSEEGQVLKVSLLSYYRVSPRARFETQLGMHQYSSERGSELFYQISHITTPKPLEFHLAAQGRVSSGETYSYPLSGIHPSLSYKAAGSSSHTLGGGLGYSFSDHWKLSLSTRWVYLGKYTDQGYYFTAGITFYPQSAVKNVADKFENTFQSYRVEANVEKISSQGLFAKLDLGLLQGFNVGQKVYFYHVEGELQKTQTLLAVGEIVKSEPRYSIARIQQKVVKGNFPPPEFIKAKLK